MSKLTYIIVGGSVAASIGAYFWLKSKGKLNFLGAEMPNATKPMMQPGLSSGLSNTAPNNIPSTAVNYTTVINPKNGDPIINPVTGTLSGSAGGAQTEQDQIYYVNLNKAHMALEELKEIKTQWQVELGKVTIGEKKSFPYSGVWSMADIAMINAKYKSRIALKEKEIFKLGFKVVGNKLLAL